METFTLMDFAISKEYVFDGLPVKKTIINTINPHSWVLYKPLLARDKGQIAEIVSLTGYLYRCIGIIITAAGIIFSLFLPLIFPHPGFPMYVVYFAYYTFLISSLLSYFLNYGQVLLDADQRNYIVTAWLQTICFLYFFLLSLPYIAIRR